MKPFTVGSAVFRCVPAKSHGLHAAGHGADILPGLRPIIVTFENMAKLLKLAMGYSDDPRRVKPTLNDCLGAVLQQADLLMEEVIDGLLLARQPIGPRRIPAFQQPGIKRAIGILQKKSQAVCADFKGELSRIAYEGGAQHKVTELLRFQDLQLFGDAELDQSIELASAHQEVLFSVEDVLLPLDAFISTLLGWRSIQPELNPLRPEVFVRALQVSLSWHVPNPKVREALMTPASSLLGGNIRRLYRELADWLRNAGVEEAVPARGRYEPGTGGRAITAQTSVTRTLLTLEKLRNLLAGDFDGQRVVALRTDFQPTLPASMALLQDMQQVDSFVNRLARRPRDEAGPEETLGAGSPEARASDRLGRQLGQEVVRLMFDNLAQDTRLLPAFQAKLAKLQPAVLRLALKDSRFFSDRTHPARRLLDQLAERSLGFKDEADEGCARFLASAEIAVRWLQSEAIDAETFSELVDYLQAEWIRTERQLRERRETQSLVLLRAEQCELLGRDIAADFERAGKGRTVPPFLAEFLQEVWPQVAAQAQLDAGIGAEDPGGFRALVPRLIWSVQKNGAEPDRARRLARMIPALLAGLRTGLASIASPPERSALFFDELISIHHSCLQQGRDALADPQARTLNVLPVPGGGGSPPVPLHEPADEETPDSAGDTEAFEVAPREVATAASVVEPPAPAGPSDLRVGCWVDLVVEGSWLRVQLSWASPRATLFMFTSSAGTAHSMSRRSLDRLRTQGFLKVVADRNPVDEALDRVAKTALINSLGRPD